MKRKAQEPNTVLFKSCGIYSIILESYFPRDLCRLMDQYSFEPLVIHATPEITHYHLDAGYGTINICLFDTKLVEARSTTIYISRVDSGKHGIMISTFNESQTIERRGGSYYNLLIYGNRSHKSVAMHTLASGKWKISKYV